MANTIKDNLELVNKALELANEDCATFHKIASSYMSDLFTGEPHFTDGMFESLAYEYVNGTEEVRKGINRACWTLIGYDFPAISAGLYDRFRCNQDFR